jgi:hypothetical protein
MFVPFCYSFSGGSKRKALKEKRQWQYTGFGSFFTCEFLQNVTDVFLVLFISLIIKSICPLLPGNHVQCP